LRRLQAAASGDSANLARGACAKLRQDSVCLQPPALHVPRLAHRVLQRAPLGALRSLSAAPLWPIESLYLGARLASSPTVSSPLEMTEMRFEMTEKRSEMAGKGPKRCDWALSFGRSCRFYCPAGEEALETGTIIVYLPLCSRRARQARAQCWRRRARKAAQRQAAGNKLSSGQTDCLSCVSARCVVSLSARLFWSNRFRSNFRNSNCEFLEFAISWKDSSNLLIDFVENFEIRHISRISRAS